MWNKEGGSISEGFAGCFLIKKDIDEAGAGAGGRSQSGYWNSIHVVDVNILSGGKAKYELSTTVLLCLEIVCNPTADTGTAGTNTINIGASLSKQVQKIFTCTTEAGHIGNIGKMIEDAEIELRSNMDALYIQKTREVIDGIRCDSGNRKKHGVMAAMMGGGGGAQQSEMQAALMARFNKK